MEIPQISISLMEAYEILRPLALLIVALAVILAAGRGSRMNHLTESRPKCLLQVGGQTILEYQIELLREAGIRDICVVVGYGKEAVFDVVGNSVHTIVNQAWAQTNSQ